MKQTRTEQIKEVFLDMLSYISDSAYDILAEAQACTVAITVNDAIDKFRDADAEMVTVFILDQLRNAKRSNIDIREYFVHQLAGKIKTDCIKKLYEDERFQTDLNVFATALSKLTDIDLFSNQ